MLNVRFHSYHPPIRPDIPLKSEEATTLPVYVNPSECEGSCMAHIEPRRQHHPYPRSTRQTRESSVEDNLPRALGERRRCKSRSSFYLRGFVLNTSRYRDNSNSCTISPSRPRNHRRAGAASLLPFTVSIPDNISPPYLHDSFASTNIVSSVPKRRGHQTDLVC
jgi:hypothetical protein